MFVRALDFALSELLLVLSVSLTALVALYRVLCSALAAILGLGRSSHSYPAPGPPTPGQFAFQRALEAHEALIDALLRS